MGFVQSLQLKVCEEKNTSILELRAAKRHCFLGVTDLPPGSAVLFHAAPLRPTTKCLQSCTLGGIPQNARGMRGATLPRCPDGAPSSPSHPHVVPLGRSGDSGTCLSWKLLPALGQTRRWWWLHLGLERPLPLLSHLVPWVGKELH